MDVNESHSWLQWRNEQEGLFVDSTGNHQKFMLHLPLDFADLQKKARRAIIAWPLLVYLHGAGSTSFLQNSKKSLRSKGLQYAAGKFILVSPICDWKWKGSPKPWLSELVEALRAALWVDDQRIYITGFSMGGMGTWEVAAARPDIYAAMAPVAGYHHRDRCDSIARHVCRLPVLVVQSEVDGCCPFQPETQLWDRLHQEMNEGHLLQVETSNQIAHQDMLAKAYCDDTKLYDWLLMFSRSA